MIFYPMAFSPDSLDTCKHKRQKRLSGRRVALAGLGEERDGNLAKTREIECSCPPIPFSLTTTTISTSFHAACIQREGFLHAVLLVSRGWDAPFVSEDV